MRSGEILVTGCGDCQRRGTSAAGHAYPEAFDAAEGWADLVVPGHPAECMVRILRVK